MLKDGQRSLAADLECSGEEASEGLDGAEELVEGEAAAVLAQVVGQVPPPVLHR